MATKSTKISAFALAQEHLSISAEISIADVRAIRPNFTHEQAVVVLRRHGDEVGRAMAIHGVATLAAILAEARDGN